MKSYSTLTNALLLSSILCVPTMSWSQISITTAETTTQKTLVYADDVMVFVGGSVNVTGNDTAFLMDAGSKNLIVSDNLVPSSTEILSVDGPAIRVTATGSPSVTVGLNAAVVAKNNIALWVNTNPVSNIINSGTIESKWEFPAVKIDKNFELTNTASGSLLSNTGYTGAGIDISADAVIGNITNNGTIFGKGAGLNITRTLNGAIVNNGIIQADVTRTAGINLGAAGLVTNGINNTGTIIGQSSLTIAKGNTTIVTNTGRLTGDVNLGGGQLILNQGSVLTGKVLGDNTAASSKLVFNPGGNNIFSSTGSLSQIGVVTLQSGSYILNHPAVDIFDFQVNNADLVVNQNLQFSSGVGSTKLLNLTGASNLTVNNAKLVGDVNFGTGKTTVLGNGLITGKITGNNTQQGTLEINVGTNRYASGPLDKIGFINVASGTLVVNNPVTNGFSLTVQPQAALELNANVSLNQGVIKTLEAIGNAQVSVTRPVVLDAHFKQTGSGGKTIFNISDLNNYGQIDLNNRTFNMSKDVSIELNFGDFYIPNGQSFVLVKNMGVVTDNTAVLIPAKSPLIQVTKLNNAADITVVVNRRAPGDLLPRSTGLEGIVTVVDQILAANPSDRTFKQMQSAMMGITSVNGLIQFYQSLIPNQNIGVVQANRTGIEGVVGTLNQRLSVGIERMANADSGQGYNAGMHLYSQGVWAQGFGNYANQKTRSGVLGFKSDAYGLSIGYDNELIDNLITGVVGGFAETRVKNQNLLKDYSSIHSLVGGVYASYEGQLNYTDLKLIFNRSDYNQVRRLALGALTVEAASEFRGKGVDARIAHGLVFHRYAWTITPEMALNYNLFVQKRYLESGAGVLSLSVARESYTQLLPEFGVGLFRHFNTCYGQFKPKAKVSVLQDLLGRTQRSRTQFSGGGGIIIAQSPKPAQTSLDANLGLEWEPVKDFNFALNYEYLGRQQFNSQNFSLTTGYRW